MVHKKGEVGRARSVGQPTPADTSQALQAPLPRAVANITLLPQPPPVVGARGTQVSVQSAFGDSLAVFAVFGTEGLPGQVKGLARVWGCFAAPSAMLPSSLDAGCHTGPPLAT